MISENVHIIKILSLVGWFLLYISDERQNCHVELEHSHGEDDKVDGRSVNIVVNLRGVVDPGKVVFVHDVLQEEVEETKWSDYWGCEADHDNQGKYHQHLGILFSKSELVGDSSFNCP